jgi:signal transduction histidine kinase
MVKAACARDGYALSRHGRPRRPVNDERHTFAEDDGPLIAHELRAPLTVVRGYLEMLGRPLDDETRRMALSGAGRAVDRLDMLLDDLVAATAEGEVFAPRRVEVFSLREMAQNVVSELAPLSDHSAEVTGDAGDVAADRQLVRQALTNLVSNAFKHTPSGGHVAIRVAEGASSIALLVQDDGPGVPDEARERVFELFERIGTPRVHTDGLGLGLPVARAIARHHGGDLTLQEGDGTGACFELELPAEGAGGD